MPVRVFSAFRPADTLPGRCSPLREKFDIVFCDAPYAAKLTGDAVSRLLDCDLLNDGAIVICESDEDKTFENDTLKLIKHNHYGRSYVAVYKKENG